MDPAQLQVLLDPQSGYSALEFHHLLSACGHHGRALLLAHLAVDAAIFCSAYRGLGLAAVNGWVGGRGMVCACVRS